MNEDSLTRVELVILDHVKFIHTATCIERVDHYTTRPVRLGSRKNRTYDLLCFSPRVKLKRRNGRATLIGLEPITSLTSILNQGLDVPATLESHNHCASTVFELRLSLVKKSSGTVEVWDMPTTPESHCVIDCATVPSTVQTVPSTVQLCHRLCDYAIDCATVPSTVRTVPSTVQTVPSTVQKKFPLIEIALSDTELTSEYAD
ncbi:hypothetical protein BDZ89DRAFT_1053571 [Hymenopellis radicata]|nr:hypothetical protein BDZ89DRAFT_1053571 [Hymenopellis radicata]